ncbi:prostaglandin F2 receptor negative regulator-like [Puntigrus tetrazona]|uniref:prostaglandin F2 receptor negative regulator-like n=1 Tax=Puntigrus tetrazona TaxID=1606681 RepID=UPI001C8A9954|nr:prostaglandin F2 receptor negative regulator-like [Puntigrus tetrazona]
MDKGTGLRPVILIVALVSFCEARVVKVPVGPLVHVEGQAVSIRCDVSNYEGTRDQDFEWALVLAGEKLLSLVSTFDSNFVDPSVRDRVNSGDISYNKLGDAAIELKFKKVRATDSGLYRCSTPSTDSVISGNYHADVELKVIGDSLKVAPAIPKSAVSEGESVELQCNTTRGFTEHTFLSVTWSIRKGSNPLEEVLTFGPDDKIKVGLGYTQRYADGGLQLDLRGGGFYGLVLKRAKPSDQGEYVCTAQEWVRQGEEGKNWRKILEKSEEMGKVVVTPTELQFKVNLTQSLNPQSTSEPTELRCKVFDLLHLQDGRLGVTWSYSTNAPGDVSQKKITVASLNEQGALIAGSQYQQRLDSGDIAVTRRESNIFILRMLQTRDADMGSYSCVVTAWKPAQQSGWEKKAKEVQSAPVTVQWTPKIPVLQVVAHRVREASTGGSTFEMSCLVTGQSLKNPGYSVLIRFEETLGGKSHKVLSLNQDSVLQLEEWSEPSRIDSVVLEKTGQLEYRFRLYGAQVTDRGFYYCDVTAWTRDQSQDWIKAVSAESNKIEITFVHTGPVFNISIHSDANNVLPGDTVQMKCIVSILEASPNTGDMAFDVRWFQNTHQALDNGVQPLISMDRWGVVKKTGSNDTSLERTDRHTFVLSLHKIQDRDVGEYYCTATPWLLSPATGAWNKEKDLASASTFLSVKTELWESLKMPVGYGLAAAVIAGVLSVLLGLAVAHCCFSRNPIHTPRPRNKLIDLEMD